MSDIDRKVAVPLSYGTELQVRFFSAHVLGLVLRETVCPGDAINMCGCNFLKGQVQRTGSTSLYAVLGGLHHHEVRD